MSNLREGGSSKRDPKQYARSILVSFLDIEYIQDWSLLQVEQSQNEIFKRSYRLHVYLLNESLNAQVFIICCTPTPC